VAKKALPGQFIILRIDEQGERIPLTIAGYDREKGTVTIIFQKVGATTKRLDLLQEGDALLDFVGPLGKPSELEGKQGKKIGFVIGACALEFAIAYPQAKALHQIGADVDVIVGFRNTGLFILVDELQDACKNLYIMTDDGSNGHQGFVTHCSGGAACRPGVHYDEVMRHWSAAHDARGLQPHEGVWHSHSRLNESHL
jgi:ferredoxin--NADP+ reductase